MNPGKIIESDTLRKMLGILMQADVGNGDEVSSIPKMVHWSWKIIKIVINLNGFWGGVFLDRLKWDESAEPFRDYVFSSCKGCCLTPSAVHTCQLCHSFPAATCHRHCGVNGVNGVYGVWFGVSRYEFTKWGISLWGLIKDVHSITTIIQYQWGIKTTVLWGYQI